MNRDHHAPDPRPRGLSRRNFLLISAAALTSCYPDFDGLARADVHTWGQTGLRNGHFKQPRAIAAWKNEVYVIDRSGRMQVFDHDGAYIRGWEMPRWDNGTPTAITPTEDGRILVPDTHNSRLLEYTPTGELLEMWGEYGTDEDRFIYVTDVVLDEAGAYYFSEYGMDADRVHVFSKTHRFEREWGELGEEPGQFARAMAIARPSDGLLYVCDTANHRIQCFEPNGELARIIGKPGKAPGELKFPYDLHAAEDDTLLVAEYGNNRISRFTTSGELIGCFGHAGRGPGEFNAPRGVCASEDGFVFVADTNNDRIQRFRLEALA